MWKLLKHDLNNTKKKFLIMFAIFLGICILSPLTNCIAFYGSNQNQAIATTFYGLFLSMCIMGFAVISVLVSIFAYIYAIRGLFSKQGYLTFTLPYKPSEIIISKLLTIIIWQVAFMIVVIIGGSIMLLLNSLFLAPILGDTILKFPLEIISEIFGLIASTEGSYFKWQIVIAIISAIVSIPLNSIIILLAFALINSSVIGSNSKMIAILLIFSLSYGLSTISTILSTIFGFIEPSILPMVVELIITAAAVIGGYKWLVYLLEYRLELS